MKVTVEPGAAVFEDGLKPPNENVKVRERILDVAERLFALHGVAETSIRTLTAEAGVNVAAVNYYFGSRDELFSEVVSRRVGPLNEERAALLEQYKREANGGVLPVEQTLTALLQPSVKLCFALPYFARLASRLRLESDQSRWDDYKAYQLSKLQPFHDELSASLPHLSPDQVEIRFHLVLGAIHQIWSQCPVPEGRTPETILKTMITFYAAGLRAPQI